MKVRSYLIETFLNWIPRAFVVTVLALLILLVDQQHWRNAANEEPLKLAYEAAGFLGAGRSLTPLISYADMDLANSKETFVVIYDAGLEPLFYSGTLYGEVPDLPEEVFAEAVNKEDHRFTWQPDKTQRFAVVIKAFEDTFGNTGFVLTGRSLGDIEGYIVQTRFLVLIGWLILLLGSFVVTLATRYARNALLK